MLELRRNGNIVALTYAWLDRAKFDPSEGITLRFGMEKVRIIGRNLNAEIRPNIRLLTGITRHRVPWVQEDDEAGSDDGGEARRGNRGHQGQRLVDDHLTSLFLSTNARVGAQKPRFFRHGRISLFKCCARIARRGLVDLGGRYAARD
jgi:hypothetical protein